jgi:hypothetical protein
VADLTAPGLFGFVTEFNDVDFTRAEDVKAYGIFTALGLYGAATEYNDADFTRVSETVRLTKTVAFSAALDADFTDFDNWVVRAIEPAYLSGTVDEEFGKENAEVDEIEFEAASTYEIEIELA